MADSNYKEREFLVNRMALIDKLIKRGAAEAELEARKKKEEAEVKAKAEDEAKEKEKEGEKGEAKAEGAKTEGRALDLAINPV